MYIPEVILTIIIIALGIYNANKDKKHEDEIKQLKKDLEDKHRLELSENKKFFETLYEEKEKRLLLNIISSFFNVENTIAVELYNLLDATDELYSFMNATSNTERQRIYEESLKKQEIEKQFENYIQSELVPIIKKNGLNLQIKSHHRSLFETKIDIPIEEKLVQLNDSTCANRQILLDIVRPVFPTFEHKDIVFICLENSISSTLQTDFISLDNVYTIANLFNEHFKLGLENIPSLSVNRFDLRDEYHYSDILINIFCVCIFESKSIPKRIHDKYQYNNDFKDLVYYLFFEKPYYNLKDYKKIIKTHIKEN